MACRCGGYCDTLNGNSGFDRDLVKTQNYLLRNASSVHMFPNLSFLFLSKWRSVAGNRPNFMSGVPLPLLRLAVAGNRPNFMSGVPLPLLRLAAYGFVTMLSLQLSAKTLPLGISETNGRLILFGSTTSMAATSGYLLYTAVGLEEIQKVLGLQVARLLIPTAIFEASTLEVVFVEKGLKSYSAIIPRTYILFHCDFTADLTLTISNVINLDQLKGWFNNDDVVAEWKKVKETMFLNVHCFVSGPNLLLYLAAEFSYHIFSKDSYPRII